jgi:RNA polymerase sigma-70 factor (ECF subfamily)
MTLPLSAADPLRRDVRAGSALGTSSRRLLLVALSEIDRQLLDRCLEGRHRAWEDFVDRYLGLIQHVVDHTAAERGIDLQPGDRDDLVAGVFLALLERDMAALRAFRRQSSLATYLVVIARRSVARHLARRSHHHPAGTGTANEPADGTPDQQRYEDREQVSRLLAQLPPQEAEVVRLYHLDGLSYAEISRRLGVAENSLGPLLSRARAKLRHEQAG